MPKLFQAFLIFWNKNLIFQTGLLVFMALWAQAVLNFAQLEMIQVNDDVFEKFAPQITKVHVFQILQTVYCSYI